MRRFLPLLLLVPFASNAQQSLTIDLINSPSTLRVVDSTNALDCPNVACTATFPYGTVVALTITSLQTDYSFITNYVPAYSDMYTATLSLTMDRDHSLWVQPRAMEPQKVKFVHAGATIYEDQNGGHTYVIGVNRVSSLDDASEWFDGKVSVDYTIYDDTTIVGVDYTAPSSSGTLVWEHGDGTARMIEFTVLDDSIKEGSETFNIVLSNPTSISNPNLVTTLGNPSSVPVTIFDRDEAPSNGGAAAFDSFLSLMIALLVGVRLWKK